VAVLLAGCGEGATSSPSNPSKCPAADPPPGVEVGGAEVLYTDHCRPFVRTPDDRFSTLAGYPFEPHYATVDGLRIHYVDEGPPDGAVVLMLHGEPSWSYLYRKLIPILTAAGYRAIAPDLMGMGRSDKPIRFDSYRYLQHVDWMKEFIHQVGLTNVTLFCQDWGSLIGLRVVGDIPDTFARVVISNGRLPVVPEGIKPITVPDPPLLNPDLPFPIDPNNPCTDAMLTCFERWAVYALTSPDLQPSRVVEALTAVELTPEEEAAYDAPYPALIYMSGPRVLPSLVNTIGEAPTNDGARAVFDAWQKPLLTVFGRLDKTLGSDAIQAEMRDTVPGAQGQAHYAYDDANHFIQEDKGEDLAQRVVAFIQANPLPP
jgi:pimeloyl-ACP methyl ester carboxylesterase